MLSLFFEIIEHFVSATSMAFITYCLALQLWLLYGGYKFHHHKNSGVQTRNFLYCFIIELNLAHKPSFLLMAENLILLIPGNFSALVENSVSLERNTYWFRLTNPLTPSFSFGGDLCPSKYGQEAKVWSASQTLTIAGLWPQGALSEHRGPSVIDPAEPGCHHCRLCSHSGLSSASENTASLSIKPPAQAAHQVPDLRAQSPTNIAHSLSTVSCSGTPTPASGVPFSAPQEAPLAVWDIWGVGSFLDVQTSLSCSWVVTLLGRGGTGLKSGWISLFPPLSCCPHPVLRTSSLLWAPPGRAASSTVMITLSSFTCLDITVENCDFWEHISALGSQKFTPGLPKVESGDLTCWLLEPALPCDRMVWC